MSFEPVQERDRVPGSRLTLIGVAGVVVIVVSSIVAWLIQIAVAGRTVRGEVTNAAPPPAAVGTVERSLFEADERGVRLRQAQRATLDAYSWVDRDAGIANIPIDRAIDLVVRAEDGGTR